MKHEISALLSLLNFPVFPVPPGGSPNLFAGLPRCVPVVRVIPGEGRVVSFLARCLRRGRHHISHHERHIDGDAQTPASSPGSGRPCGWPASRTRSRRHIPCRPPPVHSSPRSACISDRADKQDHPVHRDVHRPAAPATTPGQTRTTCGSPPLGSKLSTLSNRTRQPPLLSGHYLAK